MKGTTFWGAVLVVAVLLGVFIYKFNSLSSLDEKRELAWTPLENVLKARYDLVPKLVNVVIMYAGKEDDEMRKLAGLRRQYGETTGFPEVVSAANVLETAIIDMFIQITQRYPGITSNYEYVALQKGFQMTSEQMKPFVESYNSSVDQYNSYARQFPTNLVAALLGFETKAPYFGRQ